MSAASNRMTLEAIVFRLMVLAFTAMAVPWTIERIEYRSGAWSRGLRAMPYHWTQPVVVDIGPRVPGEAEVPLFCPENITDWRWEWELPRTSPNEPPAWFSVSSSLLWVNDLTNRGRKHLTPEPSQSEDMEFGEHLCTYPLADSTFLLVTTHGRHIHLDSDYRRLDEPPAMRRVLSHFGEHPVAGTLSLIVLIVGAWLVFRRRDVTRLSFVGLAIAALWLWPLAKFLKELPWTP